MDLERVAYNVISHFAIATVVIMTFLICHGLAERYGDWRSRSGFLFELLVVIAGSAFFWGTSAHPNIRMESGAEAGLTLLIPSAVAILDVWLPSRAAKNRGRQAIGFEGRGRPLPESSKGHEEGLQGSIYSG
jgi:hypothetical protein